MRDGMSQAGKGLPGLRGGDHVGLTVPDLEEATRFFVEVLGAERFYDIGPIEASRDDMARRLGVDLAARVRMLRFLRLGMELNLELFEYEAPDQRREGPRNSDVGGTTSPSTWTTWRPRSRICAPMASRSWASRWCAMPGPARGKAGCISARPGGCNSNW